MIKAKACLYSGNYTDTNHEAVKKLQSGDKVLARIKEGGKISEYQQVLARIYGIYEAMTTAIENVFINPRTVHWSQFCVSIVEQCHIFAVFRSMTDLNLLRSKEYFFFV